MTDPRITQELEALAEVTEVTEMPLLDTHLKPEALAATEAVVQAEIRKIMEAMQRFMGLAVEAPVHITTSTVMHPVL